MTINVEGDRLLIIGVEVTGSQSAASGKNAQKMADFFWPNFRKESLTEELKPRIDALRAEFETKGVRAQMLQSAINYLVTAKNKHARSLAINPLHIDLVVDLLETTRDQMFPDFTKNW